MAGPAPILPLCAPMVSFQHRREPGSGAAAPTPLGAWLVEDGVHFGVWAPRARRVEVLVEGAAAPLPLAPVAGEPGIFSGRWPGLGPGARYRFSLDGGPDLPDPRSRWQPAGVHGPSAVVDPRFPWRDGDWPGLRPDGLVIDELHVGTYTPAGTFDALAPHLPRLRELGVTALELMPVAEWPGRRNWGYDGVDLYAPSHVYGGPDGLRRLVDAAHRAGLGVILDVVYNHLGPDGNYLRAFSPDYFTNRYQTPWGEALNFDGPASGQVRRFVVENAAHWVGEYHVDGLRLDAVQAIFDRGEPHILAEVAAAARAAGAGRGVVVIAESDEADPRLLAPVAAGGCGLDAVWADDFHHAVHVLLTGERDGYYASYAGQAAEVARALRDGFLRAGRLPQRETGPSGGPAARPPARSFVFCLQNHDQVGNRAGGERLHHLVGLDAFRAALPLLLLAPQSPLLFMGQEFAASTPFLYFTDHESELGRLVTAGRRAEFGRFAAFADPARREAIPDPQAEATWRASCLRQAEAERPGHRGVRRLHRDLLRLRAGDPVFASPSGERLAAGGHAGVVWLRCGGEAGGARLVLANLGEEPAAPGDLPPLADGDGWRVLLCTADRAYDGLGAGPELAAGAPARPATLTLPPRCAVVLGLACWPPADVVESARAAGGALALTSPPDPLSACGDGEYRLLPSLPLRRSPLEPPLQGSWSRSSSGGLGVRQAPDPVGRVRRDC